MGTIERWLAEITELENSIDTMDWDSPETFKAFRKKIDKFTREIMTWCEAPSVIRNLQDKPLPR